MRGILENFWLYCLLFWPFVVLAVWALAVLTRLAIRKRASEKPRERPSADHERLGSL